jgi:hypothetical protein
MNTKTAFTVMPAELVEVMLTEEKHEDNAFRKISIAVVCKDGSTVAVDFYGDSNLELHIVEQTQNDETGESNED